MPEVPEGARDHSNAFEGTRRYPKVPEITRRYPKVSEGTFVTSQPLENLSSRRRPAYRETPCLAMYPAHTLKTKVPPGARGRLALPRVPGLGGISLHPPIAPCNSSRSNPQVSTEARRARETLIGSQPYSACGTERNPSAVMDFAAVKPRHVILGFKDSPLARGVLCVSRVRRLPRSARRQEPSSA